MSCQQFISNLDGLNNGKDFPKDLLKVQISPSQTTQQILFSWSLFFFFYWGTESSLSAHDRLTVEEIKYSQFLSILAFTTQVLYNSIKNEKLEWAVWVYILLIERKSI